MASNVAAHAADLAAAWRRSCAPFTGTDIADPAVTWEAVCEFPEIVSRLKPTKSPVFRSKLCHFLLPKVFPVVDGRALGSRSRSYAEYFRFIKDTWSATADDTQRRLAAEIKILISESGPPPGPAFPTVTKVVELALIGRQHPPA